MAHLKLNAVTSVESFYLENSISEPLDLFAFGKPSAVEVREKRWKKFFDRLQVSTWRMLLIKNISEDRQNGLTYYWLAFGSIKSCDWSEEQLQMKSWK